MRSSPGGWDCFMDFITSRSYASIGGIQLTDSVSDTLLLKNGAARSELGGSVPRRVLKCSSRVSPVVPGTMKDRNSVSGNYFSDDVPKIISRDRLIGRLHILELIMVCRNYS